MLWRRDHVVLFYDLMCVCRGLTFRSMLFSICQLFFVLLLWFFNRGFFFFFSSRRRHTRSLCDWSSDVCSSDLNGTWTGPSRTREPAGIQNDDWRMISFGDGFWVLNSADDPDLYLSESQGGNIVRTDMRTREQQLVVPYMGDDGGPAESAKYRFNWNSPIVPSPHDKNTVYLTGNVVFK